MQSTGVGIFDPLTQWTLWLKIDLRDGDNSFFKQFLKSINVSSKMYSVHGEIFVKFCWPKECALFWSFFALSIIFKIFFCETIIQIFTKLCSFRYCAQKYCEIFYLWKTWLSLNIYFFQKVFNEKDFWLGLKYSAHFNLTMEIFSWISLNFHF